MPSAPANSYLRNTVLTATPEQLRLMLFDGALKFTRQAHAALQNRDYEASYTAIIKAQKIALELANGLNHAADPELCDKLAALYTYIYRRMVDANIERDTAALDEVIHLLDFERQTWVMLMEKLAREREAGRDPVAEARAMLEKKTSERRAQADAGPLARIAPKPDPTQPTFSAEA